jgi:TIR domain
MLMSLPPHRWDVFIAHASSDRAQAESLFALLERDARVFVSSRSLAPGDNWQTRIPDELRASRITLALVSPRMEQAYYANEEIAIVIDLARSDPSRHRVIPVLVGGAGWNTPRPYGLQSLHALLAGDAEGMARAARAVLSLLAPGGGDAASEAWAAPRSPRAEPNLPVLPDGDGPYPPLQFITDDGRTEWAESAARLAALLEANPQHGETFLYRRYFEKRWEQDAPGVCAVLTTIVDRRFPDDSLAGRMAAIHALHPGRPYHAGNERVDGALALAEHLRRGADHYRRALRDPRHPLWFHLRFWPDEAGREGMRPFQDAFAALGEDGPAASVALHRLILWLRSLGGDPRFPAGAVLLDRPADALALPPAERRHFAAALADETSLASAWVAETAPALGRLVATWRRTHPGDVETLPCALGAGVPAGAGAVRVPADAFDGPPEVIEAIWRGGDDARARVDAFLATFHFAPLAEHGLAWLREGGRGPHAVAVALYVAARLDAEAAGVDEAREVVPVMLATLDRVPEGAAAEAEILRRLARRTRAVLREGPGGGQRLVEWLTGAAMSSAAATGPGARRWVRLLEAVDDVLLDAYRHAWTDGGGIDPAQDEILAGALDVLDRPGLRMELVRRHRRERDAFSRQAQRVAQGSAADGAAAELQVRAAEAAERGSILQAAGEMPEVTRLRAGARSARNAARVLWAGIAVSGLLAAGLLRELYRAARQLTLLVPEDGTEIGLAYRVLVEGSGSAFAPRVQAACMVLVLCVAAATLLAVPMPRLSRSGRAAAFVGLSLAITLPVHHVLMALPFGGMALLLLALLGTAAAMGWANRVARRRTEAALSLVDAAVDGPAIAALRAERLERVRATLAARTRSSRARGSVAAAGAAGGGARGGSRCGGHASRSAARRRAAASGAAARRDRAAGAPPAQGSPAPGRHRCGDGGRRRAAVRVDTAHAADARRGPLQSQRQCGSGGGAGRLEPPPRLERWLHEPRGSADPADRAVPPLARRERPHGSPAGASGEPAGGILQHVAGGASCALSESPGTACCCRCCSSSSPAAARCRRRPWTCSAPSG